MRAIQASGESSHKACVLSENLVLLERSFDVLGARHRDLEPAIGQSRMNYHCGSTIG